MTYRSSGSILLFTKMLKFNSHSTWILKKYFDINIFEISTYLPTTELP